MINSKNASLGQGQLVVFAAECAHAGMSIEDTIAEIEKLIPTTRTYGMLNNLKYAVRGGRVPSWVGTVARLLNMTPFIRATSDGRIAPSGFALGKRDRPKKFATSMIRNARNLGPISVAIGHSACAEDAEELARLLREGLPQIKQLTMAELGAALGVHAGPGTLIVAVQPFTTPPV